MLSVYQRGHVLCSIADTLSLFEPPVPYHMYTVTFVPVVDPIDFDEDGKYQPPSERVTKM